MHWDNPAASAVFISGLAASVGRGQGKGGQQAKPQERVTLCVHYLNAAGPCAAAEPGSKCTKKVSLKHLCICGGKHRPPACEKLPADKRAPDYKWTIQSAREAQEKLG